MKSAVLLLQLLFFFSSSVFSQNIQIKSLKVYGGSDETSFPVILNGRGTPNYLTIEFDVKSNFVPNLILLFRFCDKNWRPYSNIFLASPYKYIDYNMSYSSLPQTVKEADYHFKDFYPKNNGVEFPFSGKWMFYITDSQDTTKIFGGGKFYVVDNEIGVGDSLKKEQLEGANYFPADLAKIFNITTNFILPDKFFPSYVDHVEIVANQVMDYPTVIDRNGNTNTRQFYWNGNRNFSFIARDILPGNAYRQVDLRNTDNFMGPNVNAHLQGLEYSRFYTEGRRDLYGGSVLTNYNNDYATYLNVTFSIRPPNEITGGIYLVGAFNNWEVNPNYRLRNDYGVYSITVPLKRGIYDYQYVIADDNGKEIINQDWLTLEGNNWNTSNIYHIFVFYNDPDYGGYDRIIGYQLIKSN